jgi:hypothetical protein
VHQPQPAKVQGGANRSGGLVAVLNTTIAPATALIGMAAAVAMALPNVVFSYTDTPGSGAKAILALLLVIAGAAAAVGTTFALMRANSGSDETVSRLVIGAGVFATTLCMLQFLAALGT